MEPNKIIDGTQLEQYLDNYYIDTGLNVIHYKQNYSLDNYISEFNTNVIYKDIDIEIDDVDFLEPTTLQEKELIVDALNRLRERVI